MRITKESKGITLIALIITTIVMLILVAVTINIAFNGGLFTNAKDAAEKTQIEMDKEALQSAAVSCIGQDGTIQFTGTNGLDNNLPKGFNNVGSGRYKKGKYTWIWKA